MNRSKRSIFTAQILGLSIIPWLGLSSGSWLIHSAIAPQVAEAYTARTDVTLDSAPNEAYETLVSRAEAVARAATQRSFDRDILITDVSVVISAQRGLSIVPVLSLSASRDQWRLRPDPRRWSTYYGSSRILLHTGF